jgi:hypothetical protein
LTRFLRRVIRSPAIPAGGGTTCSSHDRAATPHQRRRRAWGPITSS